MTFKENRAIYKRELRMIKLRKSIVKAEKQIRTCDILISKINKMQEKLDLWMKARGMI